MKYETDDDPKVEFPIWLLGYPIQDASNPADLIDGIVTADAPDGEKVIPIFTSEFCATKFLEDLSVGTGDTFKNRVPKICTNPKSLDMILQFLEQTKGFTHVFIGSSERTLGKSTIAKVRFNIAMQME
jgi:hypothetical protein